jgi:pentatricopeptide repeat protein
MQRSRLSAGRCKVPLVTSTSTSTITSKETSASTATGMARRTLSSIRGHTVSVRPRVSPSLLTPSARCTRTLQFSSNTAADNGNSRSQSQSQSQLLSVGQQQQKDLPVQREIIHRLLDEQVSPVGSYTPENWFEAEQGLSWWTRMRSPESVTLTFQLLDRLIQERTIQARSETASSFMFSDSWLLDPELLLRLLRNWQRVVWSQEKGNERVGEAGGASEGSGEAGYEQDGNSQQLLAEFTGMCDRLERYVASSIVRPDEACFYTVLQTAARLTSYAEQRPELCEYVLQRTQQCHESVVAQSSVDEQHQASSSNTDEKGKVTTSFQPGTDFYNLVIRAWSQSARPEAPARARAVMEQMLESQVRPDALTYQGVIYTWAAAGKPYEAEGLLRRMYSEYLEGDEKVRPELHTFTTVIFAWAKSGRPEAAERAEEILNAMKQVGPQYRREQARYGGRDSREALEADTPCMNAVLSCYAGAKTRAAAQRAEQILQEMKRSGPWVDIESYNMVVKAWASVGNAERAEALLDEAYQVYVKGNRRMMPSTDICTTVIAAWAQSRAPNKVERAQAVMSKMNDWNALESELNLRPGIESHNALLNTIANSTHNHDSRGQVPASQADQLLQQMKAANREDAANVRPNRNSYTTVMHAWARIGNVDKAQAVFRDMLSDYHENGNESAKPDLRAFNAVLASFAKSDIPEAPEKACEMLLQMQRLGENDVSIQPDVYSYSSVLACLARNVPRRKDAGKQTELAEQAERILADMQTRFAAGDEKSRPNTVVYNCVLNAWALAGPPERAEALFQRMYQDYVDGNTGAKPSCDTFNTLIKAWAFSRNRESPQKAVEILERMEELHMSGTLNVFPNVVSFTTAMLCMSLSKQRGAPQRAEELLRRMDALYAAGTLKEGPNRKSFKELRKAWLMSNEPGKKKRVAAIEREMEERFGPVQQPPSAKSRVARSS